jgi:hypothetical protein
MPWPKSCAVLLRRGRSINHSARWVYRLDDFPRSLVITADPYDCVFAKVNSADTLYLVLEAVKPYTKPGRPSTAPVPFHGVEG